MTTNMVLTIAAVQRHLANVLHLVGRSRSDEFTTHRRIVEGSVGMLTYVQDGVCTFERLLSALIKFDREIADRT